MGDFKQKHRFVYDDDDGDNDDHNHGDHDGSDDYEAYEWVLHTYIFSTAILYRYQGSKALILVGVVRRPYYLCSKYLVFLFEPLYMSLFIVFVWG